MIFGYVLLAVAVTISLVAAYYSIMGLTAIFAAAVVPIIIMGAALELGKVVSTVWLHNNWRRVPFLFKAYLVPAVAFLMFLTSMGIFGFLSKAHTDQTLVSGDVGARIAIYDEKIKLSKDNIEAARRALTQLDAAVDQTMSRSNDERGAERAVQIRRSQQAERGRLLKEIEAEQRKITALNEEAAPIRAEVRKVEAEVGPIKYIAAFIYGDNPDANLLEQAVRWVIILIVVVFDPLALCLILAANKQFEWAFQGTGGWLHDDVDPTANKENLLDRIQTRIKKTFAKTDDGPNFEGVKLQDGTWLQTGPEFDPPKATVEYQVLDDVDGEPDYVPPAANSQWSPAVPMTAAYQQADYPDAKPKKKSRKKAVKTEQQIIDEVSSLIAEETLTATDAGDVQDRPGDYLPVNEQPKPVIKEAAPGPNRGVMFSRPIQADNTAPQLGRASHSDFGNQFPASPEKGDVYLRTDYLPNRLFKFNGQKWIEVDKNQTDVYAYNEMYIKHLIDEIDAGRYDADTLTDIEREQIREYLNKNV